MFQITSLHIYSCKDIPPYITTNGARRDSTYKVYPQFDQHFEVFWCQHIHTNYIHTYKHTLISTGNIKYLCRLQIYKSKERKTRENQRKNPSTHTHKNSENRINAKHILNSIFTR